LIQVMLCCPSAWPVPASPILPINAQSTTLVSLLGLGQRVKALD